MSEQPVSYAIGRALAESLAWLLLFLEEADDSEIDPDTAVRWMENAINPLWRLPTLDRQSLAAFCRTLADEQAADPAMRDALLLLIRAPDLDHDYGT
jgi:hypothetical protein